MPPIIITGTSGNDTLTGTLADETILGLDGADRMTGGGGLDTLEGGLGDDLYFVETETDVLLEAAGEGTDTVTTEVSYTLGGITGANEFEALRAFGTGDINLTFLGSNAITLSGNSGNNVLRGSTGNDTLNGRDGNDVLFGTGGNNLMIGGAGNDTLRAGGDGDIMSGGAGDDLYVIGSVSDILLERAGGGYDTVFSSISFTLGNETNPNYEFEALRASGTDDIDLIFNGTTNITIAGNSGGNLLQGGLGDDTLSGRDGNDDLSGNYGEDILIGGSGNDTLRGGADNDTMIGGAGDDLFRVRDLGDVVVDFAGGGNDTVITTVDFTMDDNQEIETLRGVSQNDMALTGNSIANTILGSDGNDLITGAGGNDTLRGNIGNDLLIGGEGDDFMVGGAGADGFIFFATESGHDRIQDFSMTDGDTLFVLGISEIPDFDPADVVVTTNAADTETTITYDGKSLTLVGIGSADHADLMDHVIAPDFII